ncbi:GtrA family protein [Microbacterium aoyamense]|uniref:GtrA family protein n=1 Tax=Microbacterium aoyamense TaxID=344166 RepID=A0ABP5AZC3_9MICO|nr:GtrA family protein [Microbacterium aoyamense]
MATPASRMQRPWRFIVVGLANTAIDICLFLALTWLNMAVIPANMISTTVALAFSFFVNRFYTFRAGPGMIGQAVRFLVVTMFALWVLQPLVIWIVSLWLVPLLPEMWALLIAKLAATVVSLIWNYLLYSAFVFRTPADAKDRG